MEPTVAFDTRSLSVSCFDPFHVAALAYTAMDQVRRAETKERPELKGSRWALLKDASNWPLNPITTMHDLHART